MSKFRALEESDFRNQNILNGVKLKFSTENVPMRRAALVARRLSSAQAASPMNDVLERLCVEQLEKMKENGTYKAERVLVSPQGAAIKVNGRESINFASNNYLGLANDASVIGAAKGILEKRGFGLASVRFICGTQCRYQV